MKTHNKLVRDKIPDIIQAAGKSCKTHVLDDATYLAELNKKLIEESNELINAKTKDQVIEELADIKEIFNALLKQHGINEVEIIKKQIAKNEKRGAFSNKIFLESVMNKQNIEVEDMQE